MAISDPWPDRLGIRLSFHNLHSQTGGRVESDMTVDEPGAGVVRLEGDDNITVGGEQDDVAAGWVVTV